MNFAKSFFNSFKFRSKPIIFPFVALPFYFLTHKKYQCIFGFGSQIKRNTLSKRLYIGQQQSNQPCEDRQDTRQLNNIQGFAVAVFDGHGGWQVSDYCSKNLLNFLDSRLGQTKNSKMSEIERVYDALSSAFKKCEDYVVNAADLAYPLGFGRLARAGSCVLVCVVVNNNVYAANAGDSEAFIVTKSSETSRRVNNVLNANNSEQRQRLKKLFPNQSDIVVCKRANETSCYVKGRLQPTRSIGDLRLKHSRFNNPYNFSTHQDFQSPLKIFTGPYISWQPEIQVFPLTKDDKYLILASDGLWDELNISDVTEICSKKSPKQIPSSLIQKTLEKAASQTQYQTVQKIRKIPQGKKRNIHDDITIVLVDLKDQVK